MGPIGLTETSMNNHQSTLCKSQNSEYKWYEGSLSGVKRPGREVDISSPSSAEVQN